MRAVLDVVFLSITVLVRYRNAELVTSYETFLTVGCILHCLLKLNISKTICMYKLHVVQIAYMCTPVCIQ